MAAISKKDLMDLATFIESSLKEEFANQHLSGNLVNTIEVEEGEDSVKVSIPARAYNMYQYQRNRVIIPNGRGSYASRLDTEGSEFFVYTNKGRFFVKPHNHIGYVDKVINDSINAWIASLSGRYEKKSMTDTGE